jgi:hypothetical protein
MRINMFQELEDLLLQLEAEADFGLDDELAEELEEDVEYYRYLLYTVYNDNDYQSFINIGTNIKQRIDKNFRIPFSDYEIPPNSSVLHSHSKPITVGVDASTSAGEGKFKDLDGERYKNSIVVTFKDFKYAKHVLDEYCKETGMFLKYVNFIKFGGPVGFMFGQSRGGKLFADGITSRDLSNKALGAYTTKKSGSSRAAVKVPPVPTPKPKPKPTPTTPSPPPPPPSSSSSCTTYDNCSHLSKYMISLDHYEKFRGLNKYSNFIGSEINNNPQSFTKALYTDLFSHIMIFLGGKMVGKRKRLVDNKYIVVDGKKKIALLNGTNISREIASCEKRYLVFTLSLGLAGSYHANLLIVDKVDKKVYRFEPHGGKTLAYSYHALDNHIKTLVEKHMNNSYTYVPPYEVFPTPGVQTKEAQSNFTKATAKVFGVERVVEAKGFCKAWCIMYTISLAYHGNEGVTKAYNVIDHPDSDVLATNVRKLTSYLVKNVDIKK